VEALIWAATRAPSSQNEQPWEFVVVTDPTTRAEVSRLVSAGAPAHAAALNPTDDPGARRSQRSANQLIRNFADTPVIVFVCHHILAHPERYRRAGVGFSAAFGAATNLIVAARSLGLGTSFTLLHMFAGVELPALLRIPAGVEIAVTMPVGWPVGPVGPVSRRPLDEVLHWNGYDGPIAP